MNTVSYTARFFNQTEYSNLEVAVAGVAPVDTTVDAFIRLGEIYITLPQTAEESVGIEPSARTAYPQRL